MHPTTTPPEHEQATATAVTLGLDPRGYPDGGEFLPWGSSAAPLLDDEDQEDLEDAPCTVLDYLIDQAGAEGIGLVEYLGYRGIGPEAEPDDAFEDDDDL
ncbi:hypothetical protein [Amycolatopsis sp. NPDC004079]|uniref:hypothetical protein n=1 Tax=Amycolatopsis sp. NPDC004079 TaxID=3154549 RepID=UPI0033BEE1E1